MEQRSSMWNPDGDPTPRATPHGTGRRPAAGRVRPRARRARRARPPPRRRRAGRDGPGGATAPSRPCTARWPSLRRAGLAGQDGRGHYLLGDEFLRLAFAHHEARPDYQRVEPVLRALAERFGETAHYAVLDGRRSIVYRAKVDPPVGAMRLTSTVGGRNPAHSTAVGKLLLAVPAARPGGRPRAGSASARLERRTARTATTAQDLHRRLRLVRKNGYAVDDQENEPDVNCLAAAGLPDVADRAERRDQHQRPRLPHARCSRLVADLPAIRADRRRSRRPASPSPPRKAGPVQLMRIGAVGAEKTGRPGRRRTYVDVSDVVPDFDEAFFGADGIAPARDPWSAERIAAGQVERVRRRADRCADRPAAPDPLHRPELPRPRRRDRPGRAGRADPVHQVAEHPGRARTTTCASRAARPRPTGRSSSAS